MRSILLFCCFTLSSILSSNNFTVGTTSGYAPYVSLNNEGKLEGFDIDFAEALSKKLGRKLILKDMGSLPTLFISLQKGKIDAIIWAISITEARRKEMNMTYYQGSMTTSLPLLFWNEIPKIDSIEELLKNPKAKIAVEAGSYQAHFLEKFPQDQIKQVNTLVDALFEIKFGKSQATICDPSLLNKLLKQYPELKVIEIPLLESEKSLGNGICSCGPLTNEIEEAVKALTEEGTVRALEEKWGLNND